jgi:hypothetical protein
MGKVRETIGEVVLKGSLNADGVLVTARDQSLLVTRCSGASTAPASKTGYAMGCDYLNTTAGTHFFNTGSITSSTFTAASTVVGLTATAAELNLNHNAVAGTVVNSTSVIYDAAGKVARSSATPAGAGANVATATALTAELNYVTGSNGAVGVVLPIAALNEVVEVTNSVTTAGNFLNVYAITGSQINALGSTVAYVLNPGCTAKFVGASATLWNTSGVTVSLPGVTATPAEINVLHGVTPGTSLASSAAVLSASSSLTVLGLPVSGLKIGPAGTETIVTSTAAEMNALADVPITMTTATTPASGTCACQFVFKNGAGGTLSHAVAGMAYSSGVDGLSEVAVTSFATLTNGVVLPVIATKLFKFVTTAAGAIGCTLTASTGTYYITFINPNNGKLITSSALVVNA